MRCSGPSPSPITSPISPPSSSSPGKLIQSLGAWGYATGFLIALPVFLIGLEVVPKTLFRRYPFRMLLHLYPLVAIAGWFRFPFKAIRAMQRAGAAGRDELRRARI